MGDPLFRMLEDKAPYPGVGRTVLILFHTPTYIGRLMCRERGDFFHFLSMLTKHPCEFGKHSSTLEWCHAAQLCKCLSNNPPCNRCDWVYLAWTWPCTDRNLMAQCKYMAFLRFIRMISNKSTVIGRLTVSTDRLHWLLSLSRSTLI